MGTEQRWYSTLRYNAESNHTRTFAAAYREADEAAKDSETHAAKCQIIRDLSQRFSRPIDVLDLGCGTGRYFHCVRNVRSLVGVDLSEHMLQQAQRPVMGGNGRVRLVRSSLHEVAFKPWSFDLVICVGVLTLWCPLDRYVLERIAEMLRPDGVFFLTVIEHEPVKQTVKRRMATAVRPLLFGSPRRYVDLRLRDFTVTEPRVRELGAPYFEEATITRWQSPTKRLDLHCVMSRPKDLTGSGSRRA